MLLTFPNSFGYCSHNITGTPDATPGTGFTANASDADGTAVSVLSALTYDCHRLAFGFYGSSQATPAAVANCLADILIDPAGGTSWANMIDDLLFGQLLTASASTSVGVWYDFPLFIKAGSSLGVQARTHTTSNRTGCGIVMAAYGLPSNPAQLWCGGKVETLGVTASASEGTTVTPGDSGAWGSWASIGTSTKRYGAIQAGIQGPNSTTVNALTYIVECGLGSAALPFPPTHLNAGTSENMVRSGVGGPTYIDLPSGSALQMRATCSGTAQALNGAFYGVY